MDSKELSPDQLNAAICQLLDALWVGGAVRDVIENENELAEVLDDVSLIHVREALASHFGTKVAEATGAVEKLERHLGVSTFYPAYVEFKRRQREGTK